MPIKIKDHGKCKEWERRRRDRLNDAFKNLAQLLPHYDPAKIPAKIDILEKSTEFVKELRLSNSRLLSKQAENDEKCKLIKELQDEVNKLIMRVKQLTLLLKKADITIPTGPAIKCLGSKRLKWSGKLKPEDVENSVAIAPEIVRSDKLPGVSAPENGSPAKSVTFSGTESKTSNADPVVTSPKLGSHSITIPLKVTNVSKTTPISTGTNSLTEDRPRATSVSLRNSDSISSATLIVTSASTITSPQKPLIPEPLFTTATTPTPLQLPLQTFILTSCPLTSATLSAQPSQILTRILPAPLLSKPLDGISFQKIPIKQVLRPIPKIIKRRKRRKKVVLSAADVPKVPQNEIPVSKNDNDLAGISAEDPILPHTCNNDEKSSNDPATDEPVDVAEPAIPSPVTEVIVSNAESNFEASETEVTSPADKDTSSIHDKNGSNEIAPQPTLRTPGESDNASCIDIDIPKDNPLTTEAIPVLRIIEASEVICTINDDSIFSKVVVEEKSVTEPVNIENTNNSIRETTLTLATKPLEEDMDVAHVSAQEVPSSTAEEHDDTEIRTPMTHVQEPIEIDKSKETPLELIGAEPDIPHPGFATSEIAEEVQLTPTATRLHLEEIHTPRKIEIKEVINSASASNSTTELKSSVEVQSAASTHAERIVPSTSSKQQSSVQIEAQLVRSSEQATPYATETSPSKPNESSRHPEKHSLLHPQMMDTGHVNNPNDKISECIARSIDLIDANDSELMELGEHWEDPSGSPKSPISPTQMFLNIFPLLPRESAINEPSQPQPSHQNQLHQTSALPTHKNALPFASSSRSSFFIDAMLPDESSVSNTASVLTETLEIISSSAASLTQCLALTPPQYSATSTSQQHNVSSSYTNYNWAPSVSCGDEHLLEYRPALGGYRSSSITSQSVVPTHTKTTFPSSSTADVITVESNPSSSSHKSHGPEIQKSNKSKAPVSSTSNSSTIKQNSENSYPSFSKSKTATTTTAMTTTSTTIVPPTHNAIISHDQHQAPAVSHSISHQLHSSTGLMSSSANSQTHAPHTCSLLDSLNSMDASFFRPLINALDAHDFRSLEFPSVTPSSLPPLIPPTKPLHYTQQFNSSSQPVQNPMSVNYHTPLAMSHEQPHPASSNSSTHSHHIAPIFSSNTSELVSLNQPVTNNLSSGSRFKKQHTHQHSENATSTSSSHSLQTVPGNPHEHSGAARSNPAERTSRTGNKQGKSDASPSKQSRSGKSSRTQPYVVPSTFSGNNADQRVEKAANIPSTQVSQIPFQSSQSTHTLQNTSTSKQVSNSTKSYNFQLPPTPSSSIVGGIHSSQHAQQSQPHPYHSDSQSNTPQQPRSSGRAPATETKHQKSKEDKNHSSPSRSRSFPQLSQNNNAPVPTPTQTNQPTAQVLHPSTNFSVHHHTNQDHIKSTQNQPQHVHHSQDIVSDISQTFQFHPMSAGPTTESFNIFPDFTSGSAARPFGAQPESNSHSLHQHHPVQRAHPYYLPDIPAAFENFATPSNVPPVPTPQQVPTLPARQAASSCVQPNSNSKFMYGNHSTSQPARTSNTNTSIRQPQQSHSQSNHQRQHHQESTPSYITQQLHLAPHSQAQNVTPTSSYQNRANATTQRQGRNNETCQQIQPRNQAQQQHLLQQPASVTTITQPPPKIKQPSTAPPAIPFQQEPQPIPHHLNVPPQQHLQHPHNNASTPQHVPAHQQTSIQQQIPGQQQQRISRQASLRTVNWMTDTGYRTNSNTNYSNTTSSSNKQRSQQSGTTNSPFSVSKLVGTSAPSGQTQQASEGSKRGPQPSTASNANPPRTKGESRNDNPPASSSTSNNQSNYCAEALIRKNPSNWNEFNLGATPHSHTNFPNYGHNNASASSQNMDHFPSYSNLPSRYQYPPTGEQQHPPTSAPQFSSFNPQSQQFHSSHHHHNQQPTGSYHHSSGQHHSHNIHPQPHQSNQIQYPPHHHHQSHASSTSSVSNFNLSSIFPEINDKRSSSNIPAHVGPGGNSNNNSTTSGPSGNMNSCSYHHTAFGNSSGNASNNLHQ